MEKELTDYQRSFLRHIKAGNIGPLLQHLYKVQERSDIKDREFAMRYLPVTEDLVKKHVKDYYKLAHYLSELAYSQDAKTKIGPNASLKAGMIMGMIHKIKTELLTKNNNNESDSRTD